MLFPSVFIRGKDVFQVGLGQTGNPLRTALLGIFYKPSVIGDVEKKIICPENTEEAHIQASLSRSITLEKYHFFRVGACSISVRSRNFI